MTPSIVLEAFGEIPLTDLLKSERERERHQREHPSSRVTEVGSLHIAFDARAELMAWSTTAASQHNLWDLFEAGLTSRGTAPTLIGWVYVGLANPTEPSSEVGLDGGVAAGWATVSAPRVHSDSAVALPTVLVPLIQCLDDSLRCIGAVDVSGFQLTCYDAHLSGQRRVIGRLTNAAGWFGPLLRDESNAFITFDQGFLAGRPSGDLLDALQRRFSGSFSFDHVVLVPEEYRVFHTPDSVVAFRPTENGIVVRMPEWTGSAVGWVLATVVDAARLISPDTTDFTVRVTRA